MLKQLVNFTVSQASVNCIVIQSPLIIIRKIKSKKWSLFLTRMHSSRMRTARFSAGWDTQLHAGIHPLPVDRMPDTCLWKHYLPATTVAGGNYILIIKFAQSLELSLINNTVYSSKILWFFAFRINRGWPVLAISINWARPIEFSHETQSWQCCHFCIAL